MIWTDWKRKNIEIALLDGSNRTILVDNLGFPNGVSIDIDTDRVYWCDAQLDSISSIRIDGTDRKQLPISRTVIMHPFGVEVFKDFVYWSDWGKRAILRTTTIGGEVVHMRQNYSSLMGIRVFHKDKQQGFSYIYSF